MYSEQAKVYDGSNGITKAYRPAVQGGLLTQTRFIELAKEGRNIRGFKVSFRHDDLRKIHSEVANIALLLVNHSYHPDSLENNTVLITGTAKGIVVRQINEWIYEMGLSLLSSQFQVLTFKVYMQNLRNPSGFVTNNLIVCLLNRYRGYRKEM